jgi:outer membrane receptor protein involved in Fe transport
MFCNLLSKIIYSFKAHTGKFTFEEGSMSKRIYSIHGFWLLCIFIFDASAQASEQKFDVILELPLNKLMELEVSTPSNIMQKIEDAPGTIVVITKQQIVERGYVNLLDLLQDLPGVDVNQKSVEEYFNQVAIRGNVGNNKFIIMQDGVRINSPTGEFIPISDNFPLFHAKQVEVAYGPVSAVYGADAFTGVINIITEKPEEIDGVRMSVAAGSDDYYHTYVNIGKQLTPWLGLKLGGHWNKSENPDLSKTYGRAFQRVDALNTDGTIFRAASQREPFVAATSSYSFYLDLDIYKKLTFGLTRSFLSHPTTVGVKPEKTIFSKDATWKTLIETYNAKFKSDYTDSLSGVTQLNYSQYTTLPSTKFTNNFANFNAYKFARGKKWSLNQKVDYKINEKHQFSTGVVLQAFNSIPKTADLPSQYDPNKEAGDQGLFYIGTNNTLPIQYFEQDYQNYGFFLQSQSKWNDQFSSFAGFRFDYDTRFNSTFNPRVGVIFKPRKSTVLKLMYAEAFLAPSPNLAFSHFGSFKGTQDGQGRYESDFFKLPNPDLGPEKSRTVDVNLTHKITENFIIKADAYYTIIEDLIADVDQGSSTFIPGGIIASTSIKDNVGRANIFGADLTVERKFNWVSKKLDLWATYSWVDGEVKEPNGVTSDLPLVAKNKIKAGFTFTYLNDYFITPKFIWVDETSHFRRNRSEKVSSYALVNLNMGIRNIFKNDKAWAGMSAFFSITNLGDVKYFNAGGGSNSFGSSPQDPRRFFFGIRKEF